MMEKINQLIDINQSIANKVETGQKLDRQELSILEARVTKLAESLHEESNRMSLPALNFTISILDHVHSMLRIWEALESTPVSMNYRGWDVHAYSREYRQIAHKVSQHIPRFIDTDTHTQLIQALKGRYGNNSLALQAIDKMAKRYHPQNRGYFDPDLGNLNVTSLLYATWMSVLEANHPSTYKGFGEILSDIGGTCVQGDSHRLLAYYAALEQ